MLPEDTDREYAFLAGGIGITVFRSMLRYIADEQPARTGSRSSTRTATASRRRSSTSSAELERRIAGLRVVLTMTDDDGWDGETRRIDEAMLREHLGDLDAATRSSSPARPGWRRASRRC